MGKCVGKNNKKDEVITELQILFYISKNSDIYKNN